MKTLAVGEFKARFAEALTSVRAGNPVAVSYGKKGEVVAVLVPPGAFPRKAQVTLGSLQGKATFRTGTDFKITDQELVDR
jgi:antitoxin (DNA-binding transcriptional repressor) of toxin-antitoxin stability system